MSLARAQGGGGGGTRGACKICGGLGHLTKQCKNGVSGHVAGTADLDAAAGEKSGKAHVLLTGQSKSAGSWSCPWIALSVSWPARELTGKASWP